MKIDILTNKDVSFSRFRWWSDWIDVAVFKCYGTGYLLQMKISRTNAKKFTCRAFESANPLSTVSANVEDVSDLIQMKKKFKGD